jgi:prophage regulatory protein
LSYAPLKLSDHELDGQPLELLRLPDVLKKIRVSKSTFYRMMAEGEFKRPIRVGRASRWSRAEVDRWIAKKIEERDEGGAE